MLEHGSRADAPRAKLEAPSIMGLFDAGKGNFPFSSQAGKTDTRPHNYQHPTGRATAPIFYCNGIDGIYQVKQYKPDMGQIEPC